VHFCNNKPFYSQRNGLVADTFFRDRQTDRLFSAEILFCCVKSRTYMYIWSTASTCKTLRVWHAVTMKYIVFCVNSTPLRGTFINAPRESAKSLGREILKIYSDDFFKMLVTLDGFKVEKTTSSFSLLQGLIPELWCTIYSWIKFIKGKNNSRRKVYQSVLMFVVTQTASLINCSHVNINIFERVDFNKINHVKWRAITNTIITL